MPAGYTILNLNTESWGRIYNESHITLYATFTQKNVPISVTGVDFELYQKTVPLTLVPDVYLLKPPTEQTTTGRYMVTFLSNGLSEGDYEVHVVGTYANGVIANVPNDWGVYVSAGNYNDNILLINTTLTDTAPATAKHRYDIVQIKTDGTVSIKKGAEVVLATAATPPDPDTDNIAIANLHISDAIKHIGTTEITEVVSVKLTVGGDLNLFEAPRVQWFIDTLKSQLGGFACQVPRDYLLFDPTKVYWEDGKLLQYLQMALDFINVASPPTPGYFTLDNIPCASLVLLGAEMFALTSIGCLEIASFFDINVPMRANLYKGDKYKDLAAFVQGMFISQIKEWKHQYTWINLEPIVITMCCEFATPVLLESGKYKEIQNIKVGEKVITRDGEVGTVLNTMTKRIKKAVTLYSANGKLLTCSTKHRILIPEGNRTVWKRAGELKKGEEVCVRNSTGIRTIKLEKINNFNTDETYYDLSVSGDPSYITKEGLIVHNSRTPLRTVRPVSMDLHFSSLLPF